ncbi:MAG: CPBP family intramembrane metalloprotease [Gemmatimonadetes bacterium]|nr:CPBP family intramembrane metalloprotease [Gemmatimonadota bacterium]
MSDPYLSPEDTRPPGPGSVLVFVLCVAVLFLFGGLALQLVLGQAGLLAAEWLLLFLPALWWTAREGVDPVRFLSLNLPRAPGLVGALLLGAGALPLGWVLGWLQTFVLPVPEELLEGLEALVTADSPARLAWILFVVALTPAVCEEVVFRGVLLGGTRSLSTWRMVLLNGVVFGAFHLSLSTPIRFLPTAALGCVIAWAVWRTGSLWVGMAMHFLNNATIVAIASTPSVSAHFADPYAPPPWESVMGGGIAFAVGVGILLRTRPPDRGEAATLTPTT